MLTLYVWVISFISLYVTTFWIIITTIERKKNTTPLHHHPSVTIAVAAWNEEKAILPTLTSLLKLDYPKDKLTIYVVNDGSKDRTASLVRTFIRQHPAHSIKLFNQRNKGKSAAINHALRNATSAYFVVCDADNLVNPRALTNALHHFDSPTVGAVISAIKLHRVQTTAEKVQRIEYIFSSFVRTLMSTLGTLHATHGVFTVFRTDILRTIGGFDEHERLTEDFEIAMRLRSKGYAIRMCDQGWNYTKVPPTFRALWIQRVRWFRGFIANNLRYKHMLFRKQYGLLSRFQIPLELFTLVLVFVSLGFLIYKVIDVARIVYYRISIFELSAFAFPIPTIKQAFLNTNWGLVFPATITLVAGLYLYRQAHRYLHEKWKFHITTFIYLFLYPLLRSLQWLHALVLELTGARKRWR